MHCVSNTKDKVCRAEISKFLVNQDLCCFFNILLIILSQKDSAPFEHALKAFHFPARSATFTPRAGEQEVRSSARSPACSRPKLRWAACGRAAAAGPGLLSACVTPVCTGDEPSGCTGKPPGCCWRWRRAVEVPEAMSPCRAACGRVRWHSPRVRWHEGGCRRAGSPASGCSSGADSLLAAVLSVYCYASLSFELTLIIYLQD